MKKSKLTPDEVVARKMLRPLANRLSKATPEQRSGSNHRILVGCAGTMHRRCRKESAKMGKSPTFRRGR